MLSKPEFPALNNTTVRRAHPYHKHCSHDRIPETLEDITTTSF